MCKKQSLVSWTYMAACRLCLTVLVKMLATSSHLLKMLISTVYGKRLEHSFRVDKD